MFEARRGRHDDEACDVDRLAISAIGVSQQSTLNVIYCRKWTVIHTRKFLVKVDI